MIFNKTPIRNKKYIKIVSQDENDIKNKKKYEDLKIKVDSNEKKLIYRGRLDSSSPGNNLPINGKDLRDAINSYISGKMISDEQFPSMGCNIKWK